MKEQTFFSVTRADFAMRLANRRNQKAFLVFFLVSLLASLGLYFSSSILDNIEVETSVDYGTSTQETLHDTNAIENDNASTDDTNVPIDDDALETTTISFTDAVMFGGMILVFLLSFFAISSITREISDGTLSLSLRLVPNRKRLFFARLLFWPTLTSGLFSLFSLIGTPLSDKTTKVIVYLADSVLYGALIWAFSSLLIILIAGIFRKGALSVVVSIALFIFLPLLFTFAQFMWYDHATTFYTISQFTPMGALMTANSFTAIGTIVTAWEFTRAWLVLCGWTLLLTWGAWKRFSREGTVTA